MAMYESKCNIGDRLYSYLDGKLEWWDVFFIGFNEKYTLIRVVNSCKNIISFSEEEIGKRFFFTVSEAKGGD